MRDKSSQCHQGMNEVKVDHEFGMRRRLVQQESGAHNCTDEDDNNNDSACGTRQDDVVSLVPADAAPRPARNRQGRLHWFRGPVDEQSPELVEWCPLTKRHQAKETQRQLQE